MATLPIASCGALLLMVILQLEPTWAASSGAASSGSRKVVTPKECKDQQTCQAHLDTIRQRMDSNSEEMIHKQVTVSVLEGLRYAVMQGGRTSLHSVTRQHLEQGNLLVNDISVDSKHRPVTTNVSRHFQYVSTVASEIDVNLYTFMPLKRAKSNTSALIVTVDTKSRLWLYAPDGSVLLDSFDLGHGAGRKVTQLVMSPSEENHFVLTVDDEGNMRVHDLKVKAHKEDKKAEKGAADKTSDSTDGDKDTAKAGIMVTASLSCAFSLNSVGITDRKLNTVMPVERGSQTYFITGDSVGGITVFWRNGTIKGRVRATEDPGGVIGLHRGGQKITFWSKFSFGFFSLTQVDVQYEACTGWTSPLYDLIVESSNSGRVILALSDGDVLIYSTQQGKSKTCDLAVKFPRVSPLPLKLQMFRGYVLGFPTPLHNTAYEADYLRELYFFNTAAMEAGYGNQPSRTIALQASFKPKRIQSFALLSAAPAAAGGNGAASGRTRTQIALQFENSPGIEVHDLSLKPPPASKRAEAGGAADGANWWDWAPKVGIFGIALVGVIIWNVRKGMGRKSSEGVDDFDADALKEKLKEKRMEKLAKENAEKGADGGADDGEEKAD